MDIDRNQIISNATEFLRDKLSNAENQINKLKESANKAPGAMQSWSDKSKDEFSQVATALSKNIGPIKKTIAELENISKPEKEEISIGSLVSIKPVDGDVNLYLITSQKGGDEINSNGLVFYTLSSRSELGNLLLKSKKGDKIIFRNAELKILKVN